LAEEGRDMRRWFIGLAALVAVGAGTAAVAEGQAAAWATYPHPELGFSIDAPMAPVSKTKTTQSTLGAVPTTLFAIDEGEAGAIILAVSDYSGVKTSLDVNKGLDGAVTGAVASMSATLLSNDHITVDGLEGREITARADPAGLLIKGRIVFAGKRLYQLMAIGPAASGLPADFGRVEASLKIAKP
jgi:hypothetical protein